MKKVTVLVTILIFVCLGLFLGYKYTKNAPTNSNDIVAENNNDKVENVDNSDKNTDNSIPVDNTDVETTDKKSDKIIVYVGMEDNFKEFEFKMADNLSEQQQANTLINEIGRIIGYKLLVNDIAKGKDGITINFNSNSAPFNTIDSYVGKEEYTIADYSTIVYTIFDSIDKTLKEYFGASYGIWFTLEDGEITIKDVIPTLYLSFSEPYQGSSHYLDKE